MPKDELPAARLSTAPPAPQRHDTVGDAIRPRRVAVRCGAARVGNVSTPLSFGVICTVRLPHACLSERGASRSAAAPRPEPGPAGLHDKCSGDESTERGPKRAGLAWGCTVSKRAERAAVSGGRELSAPYGNASKRRSHERGQEKGKQASLSHIGRQGGKAFPPKHKTRAHL